MKTHEVFGISPTVSEHSYIDRGSLDERLKKLLQRKHEHIAIRGVSKSGKSWLRQRVLPDPIVVQCRLSYTTADIYRDALSRLGVRLEIDRTDAHGIHGKITATGEAGLKLIAKASGSIEVEAEHSSQRRNKAVGHDIDDLEFVAALIKASGRTLVVEDFHYLSIAEQKAFAFDLKTLWDYGTFVLIVGVWISENMLITLNPDLSDRIEEISVTWSKDDLKKVFQKGCEALELSPSIPLVEEIAEISYDSVGLLQKLALRLIDDEMGISESTSGPPLAVDKVHLVSDAGMHVADQLNQLYQAFATRVADGIRNRNNSTGIYAYAMEAIMSASDEDLTKGLSARTIYGLAHARQPRIQQGNLKTVLARFPELQVDGDGRGLVLAYDPSEEKISAVDKQLLLYRRFATVKWPWEDIIAETPDSDSAYQGST